MLLAAGTMAVGAIGNVVTSACKGEISSWGDVRKAALIGGIANGIGYGVAKGVAALKVKQINGMPRTARKRFLQTNIYGNSQVNVNKNLHNFAASPLSSQIKLLENQLIKFKAGVYSTLTSTVGTVIAGI